MLGLHLLHSLLPARSKVSRLHVNLRAAHLLLQGLVQVVCLGTTLFRDTTSNRLLDRFVDLIFDAAVLFATKNFSELPPSWTQSEAAPTFVLFTIA